jgi:hypothetical protein
MDNTQQIPRTHAIRYMDNIQQVLRTQAIR